MKQLETRTRIGMIQGSFMLGTAALIDFVQAVTKLFHGLPIIGNSFAVGTGFFLSVTATAGFLLWFRLNEVSFADRMATKFLLSGGSAVIELTPLINALPMWTIYVACMLLVVRYEDMQYNKKQRELFKNTAARLSGYAKRAGKRRELEPAQ